MVSFIHIRVVVLCLHPTFCAYRVVVCLSACLPACLLLVAMNASSGSPMTTRKLTACLCVRAEKVRHLYPI
jgi:hypothetical protein